MKKKVYKNFIEALIRLKKFNITGFKQSLEDEGASFNEIIFMRKILKKISLKQNVKIGGCEAINDIIFCKKTNVDSIIAPMVESAYALKKFIQVIELVNFKKNIYFNLETISAIKNLKKILSSSEAKKLTGIVLGRSDICGSLNLSKSQVDNKKIFYLVNYSTKLFKKKKLIIKMGGSISKSSEKFIKKLFFNNQLHYIETRNIEIKLNSKNVLFLNEIIQNVFDVEIKWLEIKKIINKNNKFLIKQYNIRIAEIKKRLNITK